MVQLQPLGSPGHSPRPRSTARLALDATRFAGFSSSYRSPPTIRLDAYSEAVYSDCQQPLTPNRRRPRGLLMGICLLGYTQQDVSDWPVSWRVGLQNGELIESQQGTERLEAEGPGE